jgi:hypothetical protein
MTILPSKQLWIIVVGIVLIGGFTIFFVSARQISQEEATKTCQEFYNEVRANITAVDGYTILDSLKSCKPQIDETGGTDYYFNALFRVAKPGNETTEGIKANIKYFAQQYPQTDYSIWIRNDAAVNGRPGTICIDARKQIQENGEIYNSNTPKHYTDYTNPGSLPDYAPCHGI